MKDVVIVSACRTAIGKFLGSLKDVPARDLAVTAGKACPLPIIFNWTFIVPCCIHYRHGHSKSN